jgi:hypothetical protein
MKIYKQNQSIVLNAGTIQYILPVGGVSLQANPTSKSFSFYELGKAVRIGNKSFSLDEIFDETGAPYASFEDCLDALTIIIGITGGGVGTVSFVDVQGEPKDNENLAAALEQIERNANEHAESLLTTVFKPRGTYDASSGVFPSSGGSGAGGAIIIGDMWVISVAGTIGGKVLSIGDMLWALQDNPAQTSADWVANEANLGYLPEDTANKGQADGYASLDPNGKVPAAQSLIASVAGRTGDITLTAADIAGFSSVTPFGSNVKIWDSSTQTLQQCIDGCANPSQSNRYCILIPHKSGGGTYNEGVVTLRSNVHLVGIGGGYSTRPNLGATRFLINFTDANAVNNRVTIEGLSFNTPDVGGSAVPTIRVQGANAATEVMIQNCFIENKSTAANANTVGAISIESSLAKVYFLGNTKIATTARNTGANTNGVIAIKMASNGYMAVRGVVEFDGYSFLDMAGGVAEIGTSLLVGNSQGQLINLAGGASCTVGFSALTNNNTEAGSTIVNIASGCFFTTGGSGYTASGTYTAKGTGYFVFSGTPNTFNGNGSKKQNSVQVQNMASTLGNAP